MASASYLRMFTARAFESMGVPADDATLIADVFIRAEERGIPSHGMLRLKDYYLLWKEKRIKPDPHIRIVHESPSTAVIDADMAIGMVAAARSMQVAIEKAKTCGTGWVATRNSNHFGIAGYYAMMALPHDMIGITLCNANPLVAPTFSVSRLLGTNPIAVAIPAGKYPAFVADFATTPIARGKLAISAKKKEKVPLGYVQDELGHPSDDPEILKRGGAMLPLGSDRIHGSHKGYCLGALVDIFSSLLSGANFGPFVPPSIAYLPVPKNQPGLGTGHFFGAMRIDAFRSAEEFKAMMDLWIETFKKAKPAEGQERVYIPGEIEREAEEKAAREGISILPAVINDLKEVASCLGIDFNPD